MASSNISEEELSKLRQLIIHLEQIQYKFFNGRQEWITIDSDDLKLYMAYVYFGSPNTECENTNGPDDLFSCYTVEEAAHISNIIDNVNNNIIKSKKTIEVGITFTHSICKNICEVCWDFPNKSIHQWCLFRIKLNDDITYIDPHHIRTYESWSDYLNSNNLPKGIMFYPELGCYDESKLLIRSITPASRTFAQVLDDIDLFGNVMNFISGVFIAGGLMFPMLAPVVIPSAVVSASSSIYSATRSVSKITDLVQHNEPLSSTKGYHHIMDLGISILGTVTALGNGMRVVSEFKSSALVLNNFRRSLSTINAGACILQCTMEVVTLSLRIINKNKLTIRDFITLRLDLFVAIGILWPIQRIINVFENILVGITPTVCYREIVSLPYSLNDLWFRSYRFIKKHFTEFINQVSKFLNQRLTKENVLSAYKLFRRLIDSYQEQRNTLTVNDLLKHIVDDTPLKFSEEESIKDILCGQHMLELLHKTQLCIDHSLITFCINYIMEKATKIHVAFNESVNVVDRCMGSFDLNEIKKEFCKQYKLDACSMSQYVLHAINETTNDIESFSYAYGTHISNKVFIKKLVKSENIDSQSMTAYQMSVPSSNLDAATCKSLAQGIDPNDHRLDDYKFLTTNANVSLLFSIECLTIKMMFFHVHKVNGSHMLNISIYQNNNANFYPQISF